jgi:hypothetical protein
MALERRPIRIRNRRHLDRVRAAGCSIPGCYAAAYAHHLTFAQPKARGLKAGDQWAVGLCDEHHRALHEHGDERRWWKATAPSIDPILLAILLWNETVHGDAMP